MDTMQIVGWIVVFVGTFWLFYRYLTSTYDYWEKRGVKFIPPKLFFGSVMNSLRKQLHERDIEFVKQYGPSYGYFEGRKPAFMTADPEVIRSVLVKDFPSFTSRRNLLTGDDISDNMMSIAQGTKWKRIRSIVSPTFSTGKIKRMTSILMDCAETLCMNFEMCVNQKEDVNAKRLFGAYTIDVIASSAFGTKIDSHNDPDNKFITEAKKVFGSNFIFRILIFFFFPKFFKFFKLKIFHPSAITFFRDVTLKIIKERKRTGEVRNDFLQLMLDARNADENIIKGEDQKDQQDNQNDLKRLSHDELLAQGVSFFLGGYETTASTLSFASYLLANNPECQDKVIEEIDTILAQNKGEITYEAIQSMKYLDNVISETLRIYPPAIRIERQADEDYELEHPAITIPKGMIVGIPVYGIHHDPKFYPDPEKFDPDRFTVEAKANRHQYTYLPFGAGPRNCLGMRFALMEIKICLVKVLSKFRLKKGPNTKVPLELISKTGLLQPIDILLEVERRTNMN